MSTPWSTEKKEEREEQIQYLSNMVAQLLVEVVELKEELSKFQPTCTDSSYFESAYFSAFNEVKKEWMTTDNYAKLIATLNEQAFKTKLIGEEITSEVKVYSNYHKVSKMKVKFVVTDPAHSNL